MSDSQNIVVLSITGGVHALPDVAAEPSVSLIQWSIRECELPDGTRTCHLIGYDTLGREGRASTAIIELNIEARTAKTESGRVYSLKGDPGQNSDADYVWLRWLSINQATNDRDVTHSLWSQS